MYKAWEEIKCPICGKIFLRPSISTSPFCYECRMNPEKSKIIARYQKKKEKEAKERLLEILSYFTNPSSREDIQKLALEVVEEEFFRRYKRKPTIEETIHLLEKILEDWSNSEGNSLERYP